MRRIGNTLLNHSRYLQPSSSSSYVRSISHSIKQCSTQQIGLSTSINMSLNQLLRHRHFHSTPAHISSSSEQQVLGSTTYQVNNQPDASRVSITQGDPQSNYNHSNNHWNDPDDILWTCALLVGASLASAALTRYVASHCTSCDKQLDYSDTLMSLHVPTTSVTSAYQTKSPSWVFRVNSFFVGLVLLTRVVAAVIFLWLTSWVL